MHSRKFVVTLSDVYDLYLRFIDKPGQPNADANEAVDGSDYPPEQRW